MIVIIAIEVLQVCMSAYGMYLSWTQWTIAEIRRLDYQKRVLNGSNGLVHRIRSEREADRFWIHSVFVVGGLVILAWRYEHWHNIHAWAAVTRDIQITLGTLLMIRHSLKDITNRREVQALVDEEDRRAQVLADAALQMQQTQEEIKSVVEDTKTNLEQEKLQRLQTANALAHHTAQAAADVKHSVEGSLHHVVSETTSTLQTHTSTISQQIDGIAERLEALPQAIAQAVRDALRKD